MEKIEICVGDFKVRARGRIAVGAVLLACWWAITHLQEVAAFLLKIGA